MSNRPIFEQEARTALIEGARKVYKAVSVTLGARGRNVVIHKWGKPRITNDGVTVARSIELEDPAERMGADLMKQAAEETNKEAGDGTTTAVVLGFTLLEKGMELVSQGHNPMILRSQIEKEGERVLEELKKMAIPISTQEDLEHIATISVENAEYGKLIAEAVSTAGKDGQVLVEEDSVPGVRKEEVSGYKFERGFENPYMITNPEKMEAILFEKDGRPIHVLVADRSWNLAQDLIEVLNHLKNNGHDKLLIIAEEVSGELMKLIVLNRLRQTFHAVVVKCPFNKDMLEDIASLTGATAVMASKGIVDVKPEYLGKAQKIIVTEKTTSIIGGAGDPSEKIESLRSQIAESEKEKQEAYETNKLRQRLSALTGKTVILKVGAPTEAEAKYLKDKMDDGVEATRAAVEEGIVPGGGMALARIAWKMFEHGEVMRYVATAPLFKILDNGGVTEKDKNVVLDYLFKNEKSGYDVKANCLAADIIADGIIDPVKVTRCALKNALSLASMLITTEAAIVEIPEKSPLVP